MKRILDFLKENNLVFGDIANVFVNQGPGNFSGLRGSLATAKGITLSKNLNLFGYNTFIWSCANFFDKEDTIYSIIKFREKYYVKIFDKKLINISEIKEVTKEKIIKDYNSKFKVIPQSMEKNFDKNVLSLDNLNVVNLDHNKLEFLQLKGLLVQNLIKPMYLG